MTLLAYPIWNKVSHGPATTADKIGEEDQQPLVWVTAYTDQRLKEKIEKILPLL